MSVHVKTLSTIEKILNDLGYILRLITVTSLRICNETCRF